MTKHLLTGAAAAGLATMALALAMPAAAQTLAQRVNSVADGRVQFTYASREGSCGDGRSYMRVMSSGGGTEMYGSWSSDVSMPACARGPVRVVLERAARSVISVRAFVGPVTATEGATDFGMVRAQEAADYLLGLAATAEGNVAQNAIMPAMLADSTNSQATLLTIARDQTRARETRRSALTWLSRDGRVPATLAQPLLAIATDDTDNQSVRQQALRSLARLDAGVGIPSLIKLAGDREGGWTAREALSALAQSGDPRSRDFLRQTVQRAELPDEALASTIRGLGQPYATAADVRVIRDAWPKFTGTRAQEAALSAITDFGGADNAAWLIALAKDPGTADANRRRAVTSAVRAGARVSDLVGLYNTTLDFQLKDALIAALAQADTRESTDKLLVIARGDDSINARKKAIAALGRSTDPRVRKELESLAEQTVSRRP
jgi:HEAT repeat protein